MVDNLWLSKERPLSFVFPNVLKQILFLGCFGVCFLFVYACDSVALKVLK